MVATPEEPNAYLPGLARASLMKSGRVFTPSSFVIVSMPSEPARRASAVMSFTGS